MIIKKWGLWVAAGIAVCMVGICLLNGIRPIAPAAPKEVQAVVKMYQVGKDIQPGEYRLVPYTDKAYVEVTRDLSGSQESKVVYGEFDKERIITARQGQYIKLTGCKMVGK